MRAFVFIPAVPAAAAAALFSAAAAGADSDTKEKCIVFLSGYGWETAHDVVDRADINIPYPFDDVYKNYNVIQLEAGLDLRPYAGMKGERLTFYVENYPEDVGEPVYADVIVVDGEPVAGDIMTVSLHGFMHSLARRSGEV